MAVSRIADLIAAVPWQGKCAGFDDAIQGIFRENDILELSHLEHADTDDFVWGQGVNGGKKAFIKACVAHFRKMTRVDANGTSVFVVVRLHVSCLLFQLLLLPGVIAPCRCLIAIYPLSLP